MSIQWGQVVTIGLGVMVGLIFAGLLARVFA